jgi:hypothetical protein
MDPFTDWDGQGRFIHWKDYGQDQAREYCERRGYDPDTHAQIDEGGPDPLDRDCFLIDKYEHSCVYYSLAGEGTRCRWDTSNGWALWAPDACLMDELKGLKGKKRRDKAEKYARQACKLFNDWANGNVHGYNIEDKDGNILDGCGGYFGDWDEYCKAEAISAADLCAKEIKAGLNKTAPLVFG